jgi:dTDP-glucose pyrophosphorylase
MELGLVVQTSEKRPISNVATAGIYYYKRGLDLVESCFSVLKKDVQLNGSYYISSTFNELILRQKKVGVYKIDKKEYISFATTQMYENYINKK